MHFGGCGLLQFVSLFGGGSGSHFELFTFQNSAFSSFSFSRF